MTCTEFVESFSDYHDGTATEAQVHEAESHLARCRRCRRYRDVVARGADLLRSLPAPDIREDFVHRLQHRLYHVDEAAALDRHTSSGANALAVLGVAILLTAVAWSPALRPGSPVVELAPIVVSRPPVSRVRPVAFSALSTVRPALRASDSVLWNDAHTLLFEYSRLARRYGHASAVRQAGLQEDG
ncbi:MAG TPA: zf-HC2 domain-containing protein [Longimicrobiales bacterium]|nr:zf-HC2 domain-containing protein [Longimicrobiales bacterium]